MKTPKMKMRTKTVTGKLTTDYISSLVKDTSFFILPATTTTICQLTLQNGFVVVGTSACIDKNSFSKEIGEQEAYKNALDKVWELEGYLLKQRLHEKAIKNTHQQYSTFGGALEHIKQGGKAARRGWNGKDMWISLSVGPNVSLANSKSIPSQMFWSENNRKYAEENGGYATVLPCITMKTASGEILMGWLASQSDMLANDWVFVV